MSNPQGNNPLDILQSMWGQMGFQLPGMVAPTLDEDELDKQIRDLRSVENWLRMNLSMLQMTIQNLEMQKSALGTFRSMSEHFTKAASGTPDDLSTPAAGMSMANPFFSMGSAAQPAETQEKQPEPAGTPNDDATLTKAAMWPWEMMSELNAKMQEQLAETAKKPAAKKKPVAKKAGARKAAAKKSAGRRVTGK